MYLNLLLSTVLDALLSPRDSLGLQTQIFIISCLKYKLSVQTVLDQMCRGDAVEESCYKRFTVKKIKKKNSFKAFSERLDMDIEDWIGIEKQANKYIPDVSRFKGHLNLHL